MKTLITMRRRTKLSTRTSFGKRVGILLLNATWLLAGSTSLYS